MVFPFSSGIPEDRDALFKLAAKKLPWKVNDSGWAYVTKKEAEAFTGKNQEIYKAVLAQPDALKERESKSAGGFIMAVYDFDLEIAINEKKHLGADAANKIYMNSLYDDRPPPGPSGADCLKTSTGKPGKAKN